MTAGNEKKTGLFIFHRDFRLADNIGLHNASKQCSQLYVCFIFTPEQISSSNKYRSLKAVDFMLECLEDLVVQVREQGGKLLFFYGDTLQVLKKVIPKLKINAVFFNKDYTPYAVNRDKMIADFCHTENILCELSSDYYLQEPGEIISGSGNAYKKFTPFYENVVHENVALPKKTKPSLSSSPVNLSFSVSIETIRKKLGLYGDKPTAIQSASRIVEGGRDNGIHELKKALRTQKNYGVDRDMMEKSTSHLSAHLKFGTVSIREVYWSFAKYYGRGCEFIRQLYWRDFYAHLLYAYPDTMKGYYMKDKKWKQSAEWVHKWKTGTTGIPIVDAGMRELEQTGYMHNRARMLVASFLTKTLEIDWRIGEKHFAEKLTDYDVASNNGNWQNISSTGIYSQPPFRYMSPWIQSAKFDKDCVYIKKWVPELKNVDNKVIHRLGET